MITAAGLPFRIIYKVIWKRILFLIGLSVGVVVLYKFVTPDHEIPDVPLAIMGTVIAILLGFRVNNAYDRWWEARKLWGKIVNDSRSQARMIIAFLQDYNPDEVRKLVLRQIGYCYALADHLRGNPIEPVIRPYFDEEELQQHVKRANVPNSIMQAQSNDFEYLVRMGILNSVHQRMLEERLSLFLDSQGGCERIKKTVFPHDYRFYTSFFINVFTFAFPLIIVDTAGWQTIPWTVFAGFALSSIDALAKAIENPFENRVNDTAMTTISRTIEIDLLQMLGDVELPAPTKPVNGVLM